MPANVLFSTKAPPGSRFGLRTNKEKTFEADRVKKFIWTEDEQKIPKPAYNPVSPHDGIDGCKPKEARG